MILTMPYQALASCWPLDKVLLTCPLLGQQWARSSGREQRPTSSWAPAEPRRRHQGRPEVTPHTEAAEHCAECSGAPRDAATCDGGPPPRCHMESPAPQGGAVDLERARAHERAPKPPPTHSSAWTPLPLPPPLRKHLRHRFRLPRGSELPATTVEGCRCGHVSSTSEVGMCLSKLGFRRHMSRRVGTWRIRPWRDWGVRTVLEVAREKDPQLGRSLCDSKAGTLYPYGRASKMTNPQPQLWKPFNGQYDQTDKKHDPEPHTERRNSVYRCQIRLNLCGGQSCTLLLLICWAAFSQAPPKGCRFLLRRSRRTLSNKHLQHRSSSAWVALHPKCMYFTAPAERRVVKGTGMLGQVMKHSVLGTSSSPCLCPKPLPTKLTQRKTWMDNNTKRVRSARRQCKPARGGGARRHTHTHTFGEGDTTSSHARVLRQQRKSTPAGQSGNDSPSTMSTSC